MTSVCQASIELGVLVMVVVGRCARMAVERERRARDVCCNHVPDAWIPHVLCRGVGVSVWVGLRVTSMAEMVSGSCANKKKKRETQSGWLSQAGMGWHGCVTLKGRATTGLVPWPLKLQCAPIPYPAVGEPGVWCYPPRLLILSVDVCVEECRLRYLGCA